MGLFNFLKKSSGTNGPYKDPAVNFMYNLLFCDDIELFKQNCTVPYSYPYDILFSGTSTIVDFQKVIDGTNVESRLKLLAYNQQLSKGHKPGKKELLAVIIEVGLDEGLDVLASFRDGTARYINQTGKMIIWETTDETSTRLTQELFQNSEEIVNRIGVWDKPRRPYPTRGRARITFLVSDGLYFGEGRTDVMFNDPLASAAFTSGTELMQYMIDRGENSPSRR